jgi:hypothetical protein
MADADYAHTFQSWSHAFNVCQNLYDDDELEDCIDATEQDLDDPSLPLYHRMRYELLLVRCHEDWHEANDALIRCEAIFQSVSTNHKDDPDEDVQKGLQEIRELIDGVRVHHDTQLREMEDEDEEVDDVDMMDGYDEDTQEDAREDAQEDAGEEEAGEKEAGEEADKGAGEDATMKMEEMVEDDNSVKRTPLSETGEIEDMKLVVEPEPSSDSKSGVRLPTTPEPQSHLLVLPAFLISTSKNTPRSPTWSNNPSQNLSSTSTHKPNKPNKPNRPRHYLVGNGSDHQVLR